MILELTPDEVGYTDAELGLLDCEGRCIITDHGEFVLLNIYAPNAYTDDTDRFDFKMCYHHLLSMAVSKLQKLGRSVIVVGDLNVTAARIDHCEGNMFDYTSDSDDGVERKQRVHTFEGRPTVRWMQSLLKEPKSDNSGGQCCDLPDTDLTYQDKTCVCCGLVDTFRRMHPSREHAYTVWNTKTGARKTNYGTRLDYILISKDLLPKLLSCDIQPETYGSDHCPVICTLLCIPPSSPTLPPASLCTCHIPGFNAKQDTLAAFLSASQSQQNNSGSRSRTSNGTDSSSWNKSLALGDKSLSASLMRSFVATYKPTDTSSIGCDNSSCISGTTTVKSCSLEAHNVPEGQSNCRKRESVVQHHKNLKRVNRQTKLPFGASTSRTSNSVSNDKTHLEADAGSVVSAEGSAFQSATNVYSTDRSTTEETKDKVLAPSKSAFLSLFSAPIVPKCHAHREKCVLRTVIKDGPNIGRRFYCCSRPLGDKSNPEARCDFFQWDERSKPKPQTKGKT
eukprot:CAMPEP_0185029984 /NCGR_PEP_ID=MMETSP1103-20130426/16685_1 /TAXON_ID=36769 /ORGANISM="Paraphysomonas bandaiensis, Strain Caron Lab Isolate" /LENGTH=506 /DNA_ID=CAMNT_0027564943 /DNA_START=223 /DNA_END=1743 /DNA_ORIENTATION=+